LRSSKANSYLPSTARTLWLARQSRSQISCNRRCFHKSFICFTFDP
jgi:hypothetical protein